jgi:hypothetical protein
MRLSATYDQHPSDGRAMIVTHLHWDEVIRDP